MSMTNNPKAGAHMVLEGRDTDAVAASAVGAPAVGASAGHGILHACGLNN